MIKNVKASLKRSNMNVILKGTTIFRTNIALLVAIVDKNSVQNDLLYAVHAKQSTFS